MPKKKTTALPNFGDKVRDLISGFEGVVTGRCQYITGCDQILVAPPAKDGDFKSGHWFDIDRVEVVERGVVALRSVSSVERPGSDLPAPVK